MAVFLGCFVKGALGFGLTPDCNTDYDVCSTAS